MSDKDDDEKENERDMNEKQNSGIDGWGCLF